MRKAAQGKRFIDFRLPLSNGVVVRITPLMMVCAGLAGLAGVAMAGILTAGMGIHPALAVVLLFIWPAIVCGAALPRSGLFLHRFAARRGKDLGRENLGKLEDMASATRDAGAAMLRISAAAASIASLLAIMGADGAAAAGAGFSGLVSGAGLTLCRDTIMLPGRIERRLAGGGRLNA